MAGAMDRLDVTGKSEKLSSIDEQLTVLEVWNNTATASPPMPESNTPVST